MRHLAALIFLVCLTGLVSGCAAMRAQEIEAAWKRVDAIGLECVEKRRRGELSGFVAGHECAESRTRAELRAVGYPYMDLIDWWLAFDLALSKRVDAGQMTEADAKLQMAEFMARLNSEAMRRDAERQRVAAQRAAAWGTMMQGWGAMQQSLQPPSGPIHCYTAGNTVTCY